ncbi:MAG: 16S rRNA (cytidine(1402)-2'-O)-methyltransferase [Alphaproteobacteria bacterium]|nr:16S rRNA (cytidine(1402)-2'-O)-methyltransferase [Alphaproteobacteria bacterium]
MSRNKIPNDSYDLNAPQPTQKHEGLKDPIAHKNKNFGPKNFADFYAVRIGQNYPPGLYLVATPIGNLGDMTFRAWDMLERADIVACEDTRVTGKLLHMMGLKKKLLPLHDHNEEMQAEHIIQLIRAGKIVALTSDAGMPIISDPGYKLVRACAESGIYISSLPGANAPLTALQLSGLPSDQFVFLGFSPHKKSARQAWMKQWRITPATLIFFESPHRLKTSLEDCLEILGDRKMAVVRELTKKFEHVERGGTKEILKRLSEQGSTKGEIVVVVAGHDFMSQHETSQHESVDGLLIADDLSFLEPKILELLPQLTVKEIASRLSQETGLPKAKIYNYVLGMKS